MAGDGALRVRPVLFCAVVPWTGRDFWSQSTYKWDWVRPETPLEDKPSVELEVSTDITLGEALVLACEALGIALGPEGVTYGKALEYQFERFAFVRAAEDAAGIDEQVGYGWPSSLRIAREDGTVERVHGREVTFRELLVAAHLGLVEGDVTRPYIHPVIPQGDPLFYRDAIELTFKAVQAAFEYIDATYGRGEHVARVVGDTAETAHRTAAELSGKVGDEVQPYALGYLGYRAVRRWVRKRYPRNY